jgi:hypothetical protein
MSRNKDAGSAARCTFYLAFRAARTDGYVSAADWAVYHQRRRGYEAGVAGAVSAYRERAYVDRLAAPASAALRRARYYAVRPRLALPARTAVDARAAAYLPWVEAVGS